MFPNVGYNKNVGSLAVLTAQVAGGLICVGGLSAALDGVGRLYPAGRGLFR